ncbi:MAG: hypothetical protein GWO15_02960 [Nitrosopumilaceae archaeon]|nr:hypothetical protein [Nitrosopumilaceae archaeon]
MLIVFILFSGYILTAYSQEHETIMITKSEEMNKVSFDGKWSFVTEWKRSSQERMRYDNGTEIQLRIAHQDNFVYVMLNHVTDTKIDENIDKAIVCFDTKNNKGKTLDSDDYCFISTLSQNDGMVLQGNSNQTSDQLVEIDPHAEYISIGGISDENDRYSKIPHSSFEFRIPTDLIGRSDNYGFYVAVYEASSNKTYSWPETERPNFVSTPVPDSWGNLISPDKSLPEFGVYQLVLLPLIILTIVLARFWNPQLLKVRN